MAGSGQIHDKWIDVLRGIREKIPARYSTDFKAMFYMGYLEGYSAAVKHALTQSPRATNAEHSKVIDEVQEFAAVLEALKRKDVP